MAPDLVICPNSSAPESDDRANIYTEEFTTRMSSNTPNSFATSRSPVEAAESSEMFLRLVNPWSSHTSPSATPNVMPPVQNYSTVFLPTPTTKAKATAPIITLKVREALRDLSCRDQESMEKEILELKRALLEKEMDLRRRRVQAANIEAENRKLANDVETLEMTSNVGGPRTASPRRLRSKIAGLKVMLEEAHNTCELQAMELYELRRDVRLTHARELEVERNVYATEVRRLQQGMKKLKIANGKIGHENRVVGHLKAKNHHLEVMNLYLSSCLSDSLSQIPRNSRTPMTSRTSKIPMQHNSLVHNSFDGFNNRIQLHQVNYIHRDLLAKMRIKAGFLFLHSEIKQGSHTFTMQHDSLLLDVH